MSNIYLVTGANSGLGLNSVRRLALMETTQKVYMACRSESKAQAAIDSLEDTVDHSKLEYIHFDASSAKEEIFKISESLADGSLNGVLLNAGGMGNDKTQIHQINLVGHIQLVEALKPKLAKGCKIVYSGSEAARGVPMMGVPTPKLGDTPEWYMEQMEKDMQSDVPMAVYGQAKGFATLYFSHWAKQNPDYTVLTVSPGGTSGTEGAKANAMPTLYKVLLSAMMPLMKMMGVLHSLEDGTDRYMEAITGHGYDEYPTGTFLASKKGTTGEVVDQATLPSGKMYADPQKQEAAFEALSTYTQVS